MAPKHALAADGTPTKGWFSTHDYVFVCVDRSRAHLLMGWDRRAFLAPPFLASNFRHRWWKRSPVSDTEFQKEGPSE